MKLQIKWIVAAVDPSGQTVPMPANLFELEREGLEAVKEGRITVPNQCYVQVKKVFVPVEEKAVEDKTGEDAEAKE